jgi:hypothetical protein
MQGSLTTNSSGTSSGEVGEVPVGWTFVLFFLPAICTGDFELVGGYSSNFRVIRSTNSPKSELCEVGMFCELLHD